MERFDIAVSALKKLSLPDLANFILLHQELTKLDNETVGVFEMKFRFSPDIPTDSDLIKIVQGQSKLLQLNKPSSSGLNSGFKGKVTHKDNKTFFTQQVVNKLTCNFCKKTTDVIGRCEKFKALTLNKRYESVRDNAWCFNCLSAKHGVRDCPADRACTECHKRHHLLRHTGMLQPILLCFLR